MKAYTKSILILAVLILISCNSKVKPEVFEKKQTSFEVLSIHEIEVKSDADLKEFENFIRNEIAPKYNNMKGQYFTLVKGDRGIRTNKYAVILTFDSVEDRNRIYPPTGEFVGDFGNDEIWEQLNDMLEKEIGETFTDYLKVVE